MAITSAQQTSIMKLSSALFNKAFSPEMVTGFVAFYESNNNSLSALADALIGSSVYANQYNGAATVEDFGTILMAKYGLSYNGTSAAETNMKAFIVYSFANSADTNGLRTIQAVDKALTTNFIPTWSTTDAVWGDFVKTLDNKATASITFKDNAANAGKELSLATVTADSATVDAASNVGQTFTLTTGVDTITGTAGNDTINGTVDSVTPANSTLTALDTVNGGAGTDTFNVLATAALTLPTGLTVSDVETANLRSGTTTVADTTAWTGLTALNSTQATSATLTAAATTDVNVSGVTGNIIVVDGKDVTITDAKAAATITVGDNIAGTATNNTFNPAGKVTITDTDNSGANAIKVYGGTDVTVTATSGVTTTGGIVVGDPTKGTATGDVVVTQNLNSDGVVAAIAADAIAVIGGKTVNVTQNANSTATVETASNGITASTVAVTGTSVTTDVTVKTVANVTTFTKPAVELVKATQDITFKALAAGQSVTVDSLVFTAAKNLTAAEVAQAFANLAATADTQSSGGVVGNGIYTLAKGTTASSGAANGATVTFTSTTATLTPLVVSSSDAANSTPTLGTVVAGTPSAPAIPSTNAVTMNTVNIQDNATATKTIQNITVDGATAVTLGSTGSLDALKTLSLANVSGVTGLTSTATTLDMTLNKVSGAITLNTSLTSLNLNSTGTDSASAMASTTLKNLTIDAAAKLDVSGGTMMSTLAGLETITVKGAAAVTLGTVASTALKSFDASANTGGVTATIDTNAATMTTLNTDGYVFSAGNDVVTLSNSTVSTKVTLGAGDDKVTLASGTTALAAVIDAGTGTADTLAMLVADANTITTAGTSAFEDKITGFERLSLTSTLANSTVDLSLFDDISYVIAAGTGAFTLGLDKMANNGTLELTAATAGVGDITVTMADATGTADTFNIVTKVSTADITFAGDVVVAGVETINITATDTDTTAAINEASLIVTATSAKTVNVTGNSAVDLTLTLSTAVTMIDGSTMTGALTATTAVSTAATTIKGGSGNDSLTATSNNDVLIGGAGDDVLTVTSGNLVQLHGGAGKDTYVIGTTSNQSAFATINGTAAELSGDVIEFGTGAQNITFSTAKLVLDADVASFDSYVNLASNQTVGQVSYFQWLGNTYLVQDADGATTGTFKAGADTIVKITGLVDFTFNDNMGGSVTVLEIA